ncbi:hypothetical protein BK133_23070 [Paenibacillus sp. FSL H8-0548]|uniref:preprotein translocase subunit SecA n=1 Tax=Paenibacillus sp. FSL H8-0548 TaxID=1920422 RepID=UPI00096FFE94|nr:DEAD/DEAH box helicase [Paenibacillus sp. FSL H8-0548]OMF24422.1 hypothetical protein BK133_23070 [Paenibacillus sp. FSL H8-0548]
MLKLLQQVINGTRAWSMDKHRISIEQINKDCSRLLNRFPDVDLSLITDNLRQKIKNDTPIHNVRMEAYSLVKAACRRVFDLDVHNEQILGALAIYEGNIAEMKTGEGKTITAIFPAFLQALTGKKVHIATVNEYLAFRDSEGMSKVFHMLGLSVGCLRNGMNNEERQSQYACDVTYGTHYEFGFDYLRDHLVNRKEDRVQCGLHFLLLDEADSILIDEARTPLLISSAPGKGSDYLVLIDQKISLLADGDFEFDAMERHVSLTHQGIDRCEQLFGIRNLMNLEHSDTYHKIQQALRARFLMKRDIDYVIRINEQGEQEVVIVDQSTGRLMFGRRYTEGLHQAIEAKERVVVNGQSATLASITLQHFVQLYEKVGGMSGTAVEVESELQEVYGIDVAVIPTHRPIARSDQADLLFFNEETKYRWIMDDIKQRHAKGQPVLVGTPDIRASERLSQMLASENISHHVLNAKNAEKEAAIIREAGMENAVTIATNMAGRGVDIWLGPGVEENGGLHVIGTCRHNSARIDNQLKGRSGRQGSVGSSRFYISLEDDLLVNYYSDDLLDELEESLLPIDRPITQQKYIAAIRNAQRAAELEGFALRASLIEWDKPVQQQRMIYYHMRNDVVDRDSYKELLVSMIDKITVNAVNRNYPSGFSEEPPNWFRLFAELSAIFPSPKGFMLKQLDQLTRRQTIEQISEQLYQRLDEWYEASSIEMDEFVKHASLRAFDRNWIQYLEALNVSKESSFYSVSGSQKVDYERETAQMFEGLLDTIHKEVLTSIWARVDTS